MTLIFFDAVTFQVNKPSNLLETHEGVSDITETSELSVG